MVKITYSSHVVAGRLGHRWLSKDEITEVFGFQGALPNEARDQRLLPMNDLYSLAGGCLLADVVQYFEERGVPCVLLLLLLLLPRPRAPALLPPPPRPRSLSLSLSLSLALPPSRAALVRLHPAVTRSFLPSFLCLCLYHCLCLCLAVSL